MKFKNTKEAINYIKQVNGMTYSKELFSKVDKFLHNLPHNPKMSLKLDFEEYMAIDYNEGWFVTLAVKEIDGKIQIIEIDADMLDENKDRVKTNEEALELLKEYRAVKFPSDYDEYWQMSDDYKYWSRMNEESKKAEYKQRQIASRL